METMNDYSKEIDESMREINVGDIVKGTVLSVSEEAAVLDLHSYAQGIIKAEDMSDDPKFSILEDVHEGDEIEATVKAKDDGNGNIVLSRKEANEVLAWDRFQQMMDEKTVLRVTVSEAVKGGVITWIDNVRAFIPVSKITAGYVENPADWVGKEIDVRIIGVEKARKNLILSGREVAREQEQQAREDAINAIAPGTVMEGTVATIKPYGAFINLGNGIDGLVHISQISQKRVEAVGDVLKEGQQVQVKVINVKDGRISLSMKALEEGAGSGRDRSDRSDRGDRAPREREEKVDLKKYVTHENATTSLGDLLKNIKLD